MSASREGFDLLNAQGRKNFFRHLGKGRFERITTKICSKALTRNRKRAWGVLQFCSKTGFKVLIFQALDWRCRRLSAEEIAEKL